MSSTVLGLAEGLEVGDLAVPQDETDDARGLAVVDGFLQGSAQPLEPLGREADGGGFGRWQRGGLYVVASSPARI